MMNYRTNTLISSLLCVMSYTAHAEAKLNIEALSNNNLAVPKNEYRSISYKVSNLSSTSQTFVLQDMPGVFLVQDTPNSCHAQTELPPHQSCVLNLKVDASPKNHVGPTLCDTNLAHCTQPKLMERMTVETLPEGTPTVSLKVGTMQTKPNALNYTFKGRHCSNTHKKKHFGADNVDQANICELEIFSGVSFYGAVEVENTGTIPIYFTPPTSPYLISSPPDSCTEYTSGASALQPLESCYFYYQGTGSSGPTNQSFTVYPVSNTIRVTQQVNYSVQLYNIGDYYPNSNGEQIFQLPTGGPYIYTMYTVANNTNPPSDQLDAILDCPGDSNLPSIDLLQTLYGVSNCVGGVITGFNCSSTYWSASDNQALNFATGTPVSVPYTNLYPSRCVTPVDIFGLED